MRIRPTELGLKGVLLLCALEIAFLATAYSNLFFLLIAFCCVLGGLGLLWGIGNARRVRVVRIEVPLAAAGDPRELRIVLRNDRRIAAFDLAVKLTTASACSELLHVARLAEEVILTASLPPQSRGIHAVTTVHVVSRYPFGLFQVTRKIAATAEIATHPRPFTPIELAARSGDGAAELGAPSGARSNIVAGLRPFRTGDATADIHWKATARRGQPVVKERERDTGDTIEVVLDRRCDGEKFEAALSLATTMVLQACASLRPVQLRSQNFAAALGGNRRSPVPILRWLAATTSLPRNAPPPPRGGAGAIRLPARHATEPTDA